MDIQQILNLEKTFEDKGYAIIDSKLDESILDAAIIDLSTYYDEEYSGSSVPFANPGRIQDGWFLSKNVYDIAQAPSILKALKHLYGATAKPFQTLNFPKGTEQPVHSDSIHFNSEPFGMMCGVWVALEDISADQGPLIYYPGSHKLPEMNFEDFDLPPSYDYYTQYLGGLQQLIEEQKFVPEYGVLKKGQALIWSANLLHGGHTQNDPTLSRHSQVTHYYMGGPKCWRPGYSEKGRSYFKPRKLSATAYRKPHSYRRVWKRRDQLSFFGAVKQSIAFRIHHYFSKD